MHSSPLFYTAGSQGPGETGKCPVSQLVRVRVGLTRALPALAPPHRVACPSAQMEGDLGDGTTPEVMCGLLADPQSKS